MPEKHPLISQEEENYNRGLQDHIEWGSWERSEGMQTMRIDRVSFRANVASGGGSSYQHIHVEASASLEVGESAHEVLASLKVFVASELRLATEGETRQIEGRFRDLLKSDRNQ